MSPGGSSHSKRARSAVQMARQLDGGPGPGATTTQPVSVGFALTPKIAQSAMDHNVVRVGGY